ncbi:MAG: hypothetical protein P8X64_04775 [Anaerolineales bacterium]
MPRIIVLPSLQAAIRLVLNPVVQAFAAFGILMAGCLSGNPVDGRVRLSLSRVFVVKMVYKDFLSIRCPNARLQYRVQAV